MGGALLLLHPDAVTQVCCKEERPTDTSTNPLLHPHRLNCSPSLLPWFSVTASPRRPLEDRPVYRWLYNCEAVMSAASTTLLPLSYNLEAAAIVSSEASAAHALKAMYHEPHSSLVA